MPITLQDRWNSIFNALGACVLLLVIAFIVHAAVSKGDRRKQVQGRPICWWVPALTFVGWCIGICYADSRVELMESAGAGGFGLLVGLLVGHIHGAFSLAFLPAQIEATTDEIPTATSIPPADSDNPYAPLTVSKQTSSIAP